MQNPSTTKVLEQREGQKLQLYSKTTNNLRQTNSRPDKHNIIRDIGSIPHEEGGATE